MTSVLTKIMSDDFIWAAIISRINGKRARDYTNINCPMCQSRGESKDTRYRCGVRRFGHNVFIHCFNCKFKAVYAVGEQLSPQIKQFMASIGIGEHEIRQLNFKAFEYSKFLSPDIEGVDNYIFTPNFPERELPARSKLICDLVEEDNIENDLIDVIQYLDSRGEVIFNYPDYYWSPVYPRRFIIPYYFRNNIVGWTARTIDKSNEKNIKYLKSTDQENFLYNNYILSDWKRKYVILVEGPLDAIAIDAVALSGSSINDKQAQWLNSCGKEIILLADNDSAGKKLIDKATEYKWSVAFPRLKDGIGRNNWWEIDVKDAADAVKKYGKLYTLQSILQTKTKNKLEIEIKRKFL